MSGVHLGLLLAMISAVTTASAHALLKAGRDRLAVRGLIGLTGFLAAAPLCLLVAPPTTTMIPWLAGATFLHTTYQFVLLRSYAISDFAAAYPIARGTAPIASSMIGAVLLGERLTVTAALGVALVSGGILLLSAGRGMSRPGLIAALSAGLLTAAYTAVDARAVRLAPQALTFVAWFFLCDGLVMFPIFAVARRGRTVALLRSEGRQGVLAGLMTLVSFGAALFALDLAPIGVVSGLRETSVVVGVLLAQRMLREPLGAPRMIGALVVAAGAMLIVTGEAT